MYSFFLRVTYYTILQLMFGAFLAIKEHKWQNFGTVRYLSMN